MAQVWNGLGPDTRYVPPVDRPPIGTYDPNATLVPVAGQFRPPDPYASDPRRAQGAPAASIRNTDEERMAVYNSGNPINAGIQWFDDLVSGKLQMPYDRKRRLGESDEDLNTRTYGRGDAELRAQQQALKSEQQALVDRNQAYIDKNQIYDAQGNKIESNPFWTNLRSRQSDISSTFDNQQHSLSGVLASRGMMGSGQELASRSALAGGQARTLADFEKGGIERQQDILRDLEMRQQDLLQGKIRFGQGMYTNDQARQQAAAGREAADASAFWKGATDIAVEGGKLIAGLPPNVDKIGSGVSNAAGGGGAVPVSVPTMGWDTFKSTQDPSTWEIPFKAGSVSPSNNALSTPSTLDGSWNPYQYSPKPWWKQ